MELDPLFAEQRWKILQSLGSEKLSPLQLASKTSTTISNISQQLKLLEAANIVKKERIRNRDKGKPRAIFSLSNNFAYIVTVMNGFVEKKLLPIENGRKTTLKIWFLSEELQKEAEQIYNELAPCIEKVDSIILNESKKEVWISSKPLSKELLARFNRLKSVKVRLAFQNEHFFEQAREAGENLITLYDRLA